ncbi:MAG TPA: ATP-dependent RecD-like DNA helicase [Thermoanaerobaculia bacterium]
MKTLSTIYPLRHVSIRVPWHDAGWNGTVCGSPRHNTACIKLVNIAEKKNDVHEEKIAGRSLRGMDPSQFPPCVVERGTFMADFALDRLHEHPYVKSSPETHAHFRPTRLHYPAYGAAGLPFRWMMKPVVFGDAEKGEAGLVDQFPLESVDIAFEPELKFQPHWVQDHRNHRALLDCFWKHVQPEDSLVFFYAKQVPLVEDPRRVLIGVGRVVRIGPLTEYDYEGSPEGKTRSLLWERMVVHSIRKGFEDGFLLPYHEALAKCDEGRAFDPTEVVAFAPEERFTEFSYATEHVGNDAAISALLACRAALLRAGELFSVTTAPQEQWIDQQLGRLWERRGPFPGFGAILSATGVPLGNFIAQALVNEFGEEGNLWSAWDAALSDPRKYLPAELIRQIDTTIVSTWQHMLPGRRQFLELLSRVDLSTEQAKVLAVPEVRCEHGINPKDEDFLRNPYLFYEATRLSTIPVAIGTVDRGLFPTAIIRKRYPLSEPSTVQTAVDGRRLRALVVRELEEAALRGDTLRAQADVITTLRRQDQSKDEQRTNVTADLLATAEVEYFSGEIHLTEMADGRRAYQLERLAKVGNLIRTTVSKRVQAPRHELSVDWRAELDQLLGVALPIEPDERTKEENARQEKAATLAEIAAARFSVLIGPAGTGKTTLLSVLCRRPEIHQDGIVMLAPTGKARVRMEEVARQAGIQNFRAYTLAQFLASSKRYDGRTQRYLLIEQQGDKVGRTVIVDECSMLTEEMMAALLEALSGVHRLIFVGDPRQLPPIGAGRPFADIVVRLRPEDIESRFPRVGNGYGELTVPRRQGAGEREDLQLAAWFGGSVLSPGEDQIFEILAGKRTSETIQLVHWETPDELESLLPKTLGTTLGFDPKQEEWQAFACSLGGNLDDKGSAWFNPRLGKYPGCGRAAEAWQILSPVRQKPWGVDTLNRNIHLRYKGQQIEKARNPGKFRSIPLPQGDSQIVYGDKVINNRNWSVPKGRLYPKPDGRSYLANGEIGMVVGHRYTQKRNWLPKNLEVEFSTQQGTIVTFYPSDFSDDREASLELAYALTVHKAQGSEFEVVFLILPRSPLMLTRELLYTALTRQKQKIVVFHQGSATDLQRLSSDRYSATATRLTNLFEPPNPKVVGDSFLENRLIHRTSRGEAVRSKSEVIIANLLHAKNIAYYYEHPLELGGVAKYPDFTIEDDDTGITYYWEHCGLLHDPAYHRRWEEKQQWYRENGILPLDEGGGPSGTLIVTRDQPDGGIDSPQIADLIAQVFSM